MAEAIGLAASVITVAGVGLKLSLTLREAVSDVKCAANHVHDIATSISLFSSTLRHIGKFIQGASSPHSQDALDTLEAVVRHCDTIFDQIEDMIREFRAFADKGNGAKVKLQDLQNKVKFCFRRTTIGYMTGQLESSKLTLSIMLQVFQLGQATEASRQHEHDSDPVKQEITVLREEIRGLVMNRYWAEETDRERHNNTFEPTSEMERESELSDPDSTSTCHKLSEMSLTPVSMTVSSLIAPCSRTLERVDRSLKPKDVQLEGAVIATATLESSQHAVSLLLCRWCNLGPEFKEPIERGAGESHERRRRRDRHQREHHEAGSNERIRPGNAPKSEGKARKKSPHAKHHSEESRGQGDRGDQTADTSNHFASIDSSPSRHAHGSSPVEASFPRYHSLRMMERGARNPISGGPTSISNLPQVSPGIRRPKHEDIAISGFPGSLHSPGFSVRDAIPHIRGPLSSKTSSSAPGPGVSGPVNYGLWNMGLPWDENNPFHSFVQLRPTQGHVAPAINANNDEPTELIDPQTIKETWELFFGKGAKDINNNRALSFLPNHLGKTKPSTEKKKKKNHSVALRPEYNSKRWS